MIVILDSSYDLSTDVNINNEKDFYSAQSWQVILTQNIDNTENISQI
jgi:hypothetical protein